MAGNNATCCGLQGTTREWLEMTTDLEISNHDMRLYIIGDIHGRSDLLDRMVDEIKSDIAKYGRRECLTITLGDYVDRGPDSRGVLDRLARNPFPTQYLALKGNHEALLEDFLDRPSSADQWRRLGGLETLHSYGVPVNGLMIGKGFEEAARELNAAVPEAHRTFLNSLSTHLCIRDCFICHAGIRPSVPLDRCAFRRSRPVIPTDRDQLFRSIATSVARVLRAPLDDGGDVSLLFARQARREAVPVVNRRDPRAARSALMADAAARAGGPC